MPDPPKPGPDDLPGRVVDKSGAGVAGRPGLGDRRPRVDAGDGGEGDDRRPGPVRGAVASGPQLAGGTPRTSACSPAAGTAGSAGSIRSGSTAPMERGSRSSSSRSATSGAG